MRSSGKLLKASLRLLVFVGVLRFLVVVRAYDHRENGGRRLVRATDVLINKGVAGNMEQDFVEAVNMGKKKHIVVSKFEVINYISKRRVPNGPDPIHNRRAGNSNRPPGHA